MARFEQGKKYKGRITRVTVGETKEKKTPQIVFTVEVEPDGEERSVFRYLTENTIDYVIKDLQAMGYCYDDFDHIDPDHPNAHNFVGREVFLRMKYETYEGKERERWDFAFGGGLEVAKLDRQGVSRLNAVFGSKLRAAGMKKPTAPAGPPSVPSAGGSSEESF